jgi:hypothetical protein
VGIYQSTSKDFSEVCYDGIIFLNCVHYFRALNRNTSNNNWTCK